MIPLCKARLLALIAAACFVPIPVRAGAEGPATQPAVQFTEAELRLIFQHSPLPPPPPDPTNAHADNPAAARLGQALFFEQRFSSNGQHACATCHDPARAFTDGEPLADGVGGRTQRHTPTVLNAAYHRWQFWDGRADSLWSQALQPIENDLEMNFTRSGVAHVIHDDAGLRSAYEAVFGPLPPLGDEARFPRSAKPDAAAADDPRRLAWQAMSESDRDEVNRVAANVGKAIAAYERRLVSRSSPFDRFVAALRAGDANAHSLVSESAQRGLKLFIGTGKCRVCHSGPNFTDGEFHNTGVPPLAGGMPSDAGRYDGARKVVADPFNSAGRYSDAPDSDAAQLLRFLSNPSENWGLFKTPSLRNAAATPPYMHQGQFATLAEVVRFYSTRENAVSMGHHRQETILTPLNLSPEEQADLVAFLETLTGLDLDESLLRPPAAAATDSAPASQPASE